LIKYRLWLSTTAILIKIGGEGAPTANLDKTEPEIPRELPNILLEWYDGNARPLPWRNDCVPYHIWLSEIMLQQTRVETVKTYYMRFLEEIPTIEALANIDEEKLLKLWEGLGYYSRARNLQKTAKLILSEYGGHFPCTYEQLLKLPGVGAYTAGAIASICFGQPTPAVDGNVLRVISRIAGIYENVDIPAVKKSITASLAKIYPTDRSGDFTQSLMELGATICLPRGTPKCHICPSVKFCKAIQDNSVLDLPIKQIQKAKKIQVITLFVFSCKENIAIHHRKKEGLLAGLWEFPNVHEKLDEQQAIGLAAKWKTKPVSLTKSSQRVHVFTHIKWYMTCYYIDCSAQPTCFTWADHASLLKTYPLPTAFKMFLEK
jgi:A/G-specific adenine glycosylase